MPPAAKDRRAAHRAAGCRRAGRGRPRVRAGEPARHAVVRRRRGRPARRPGGGGGAEARLGRPGRRGGRRPRRPAGGGGHRDRAGRGRRPRRCSAPPSPPATSAPRTTSPTWAACARPGNAEVAWARAFVAVAARLAGIPALDMVTIDFRDGDRFTAEAREARALGYAGKMCIHPAQVPLARGRLPPHRRRGRRGPPPAGRVRRGRRRHHRLRGPDGRRGGRRPGPGGAGAAGDEG